MSELERTRQQLDPVGSLTTRIFAIALSAGAFAYGITMSIRSADQTLNPLIAILAIVLLGGAALTVIIASSSHRAPFTASTHMVVQLLALGSIVLSAASQWGTNKHIQDDFGPISLGMLLVAMGVYRPARELASFGALASIFVGFITLLKVPGLETHAPPASIVLVGMAPVIAMAFGSAAYSARLVGELDKWQHYASQSVAEATSRLTGGIERSVRQDRIRILDRDVFPFLNEILGKETVTEDDRVRARSIAESIRMLMVAEADQTWLEVAASDHGITRDDVHHSVADASGRANGMVTGQRTALRAFLVALRAHESFVKQSLKVAFSGTQKRSRCVLSANIHDAAGDPRETFAPYFAVMRVVFSELKVGFDDNKLTVRFSYEQR